MRKASFQAAADFADDYFDFVYIDAAHDYKSVLIDLFCWWPKVRPGGILAGHDYLLHVTPELRIEVPKAVNEFFSTVACRRIVFTQEQLPSWFVVK